MRLFPAAALLLATAVQAATYTNPIIPKDNTPDPGVLLHGGTYYMTTTSGNDAARFPIHTSRDLVAWSVAGHVFPTPESGPPWAASNFWAPEIHAIHSRFVVFFTARNTKGVLCVGAAVGDSPLGPFVDVGQPLVEDEFMGHIDPSYVTDADGQGYLLWKVDGNAVNKPTPIMACPVVANGTAFAPGSTPTQLIVNDLPWEAMLVEAPWMVATNGSYFLFYSGNIDANYAVGVARGPSPLGPFTKFGPPVYHTAGGHPSLVGPGHCAVTLLTDGSWAMFTHTWAANGSHTFSAPRHATMDAVEFVALANGTWPTVNHGAGVPSTTAQPVP